MQFEVVKKEVVPAKGSGPTSKYAPAWTEFQKLQADEALCITSMEGSKFGGVISHVRKQAIKAGVDFGFRELPDRLYIFRK